METIFRRIGRTSLSFVTDCGIYAGRDEIGLSIPSTAVDVVLHVAFTTAIRAPRAASVVIRGISPEQI